MILLGSVRNTNGTHGASNTAGTDLIHQVRPQAVLDPPSLLSLQNGDSILFKDENASRDGSTSIKHAPREYGDKRPIHM